MDVRRELCPLDMGVPVFESELSESRNDWNICDAADEILSYSVSLRSWSSIPDRGNETNSDMPPYPDHRDR